jgi:two-component system OmpR family sensor kinase/two-component system sensor histidine kinase BaeS
MRLRLILSFVLIVLVTVAGMVIIARQGATNEVRAFMARGGMVRLDNLVTNLEDYYARNRSWEGAGDILAAFSSPGAEKGNRPEGAGQGMGAMMSQDLILADRDGNVVADSSGSRGDSLLSASELELALPLKSGWTTVGYLLPSGGTGFTAGEERFLVTRLTNAAFLGGLAAGGIALLLAYYLATRLIHPVQALTSAAHQLSQGDLSQRVAVTGEDELAALGQAFNHMANSLQQVQENRRAMTADIAHELRTPLAVQRANLEALQDGIYTLSAENLAPILEQNYLLTRLVDDLRTLALADAGQLPLELTPTNLPALVERIIGRFRPQAEARQINVNLQIPESCPAILLDPTRIEQVLGNLLSNALRYIPQNGIIEVSLVCATGQAELTIHDSGPGIPVEALERVFERFYRADRSRSREEGGSGLGLAIARQLVEAHGGMLSAANHPQGGAVFTLRVPLHRDTDKHAKK